jgi:hypothetical protein
LVFWVGLGCIGIDWRSKKNIGILDGIRIGIDWRSKKNIGILDGIRIGRLADQKLLLLLLANLDNKGRGTVLVQNWRCAQQNRIDSAFFT